MSRPPYRALQVALRIFSATRHRRAVHSPRIPTPSRGPGFSSAALRSEGDGWNSAHVHRGHPANLSWPPHLGTIGHQTGVRSGFLLSAATGGALEAGRKFLKNEREGQGEETWPGVTPFAFGRA
jgi:hypothetical protein